MKKKTKKGNQRERKREETRAYPDLAALLMDTAFLVFFMAMDLFIKTGLLMVEP